MIRRRDEMGKNLGAVIFAIPETCSECRFKHMLGPGNAECVVSGFKILPIPEAGRAPHCPIIALTKGMVNYIKNPGGDNR